jgi:hypothetical protein
MATRTYKPGLLLACKVLLAFIGRNRTRLEQNLSPQLVVLLESVVEAVQSLTTALDEDIGDPI